MLGNMLFSFLLLMTGAHLQLTVALIWQCSRQQLRAYSGLACHTHQK